MLLAPATMLHRYSFNDGTPSDSIGGPSWTGTLGPSASISGGQLILPGGSSASSLQLPPGILGSPSSPAISLEMWVTTSSTVNSNGYVRIFQFGGNSLDGALHTLLLSRDSVNNGFLLYNRIPAVLDNTAGTISTQSIATTFTGQTNMHVVLVLYNGGYGIVYINGALIATTTASGLYFPDGSSGETNYLGYGTLPGDGLTTGMVGSINEFRVWQGVLSATDVLSHYSSGPDQTSGNCKLLS